MTYDYISNGIRVHEIGIRVTHKLYSGGVEVTYN